MKRDMEEPIFREHFWQIIIEYQNGVRIESDLFRRNYAATDALQEAVGEKIRWHAEDVTFLRAVMPEYHFIPGVRDIYMIAVFVDENGDHLKRSLKHMIEVTCQEEEDKLWGKE